MEFPKRRISSTRRQQGFTVIELLVVIGIIAVLAALLLPALEGARDRARIVICSSNLRQWGLVYCGYQADYKEFFGGAVNTTDMRFMFTATNRDYPPDNVAPWGGGTYYEQSPYNRSTLELAKRGLLGKVNGQAIIRCPGRLLSRTNDELTYGGGLDQAGSLTYVDYVVFCGFGNKPDTGSTFSKDVSPDTVSCWGHDYTWFQSTTSGFFPNITTKARFPITRTTQKRSPRTVLVMDRHFAPSTTYPTPTFWGYYDIGDYSNHSSKRTAGIAVPAEGPAPAKPVDLAAGSNCLMVDLSVTWTAYEPTGNFYYARDYYYRWAVGKNLANY